MKKRNLVLNIFLSSIILSFNNLPMQVKANENADVRYNILLKNPESVDDIEMNFEKQGIKVTDKIPEI
ncbi:TPA: peptidase S8, partial [Streptococcus suis]|nr:peptidase S8 [Streptococcus suis]